MTIDPQRAQTLFLAAVETSDAVARRELLDRECAEDDELRQRVEALLSAHDAAGGFGDEPSGQAFPATIDSPSSAQTGDRIGHYKLLESIGEGGMGTVWVAQQTQPIKRRVAIKLIKAGMDSRSVLARFEAERQALAMMDHPNIARVLDGGMTEQGRPYFAMEYVKGVPLTEYCDQASLSVQERLELFLPICQAVQHAHQKGIIHRDLKPTNILVCLYDGKPVPKVIDFGLAKAMHQSLTEQSLYTVHGLMVGTPLYMSPEQAEHNNLDIDTRSDIYSLGVILYELLTGSTPLEKAQLKDAAVNEILRLIKDADTPKPSTRLRGNPSLPSVAAQRSIDPAHLTRRITGDLDWVVMKALEKERSRRYETASGLAADILRHLADEPVSAGPPSRSYRMKKFIKRNRAGVIVANMIAMVVLLGVIGTTTGMLWALDARNSVTIAKNKAELKRIEAEEQRTRAEEGERLAELEKERAVEIKRIITDMLKSVKPGVALGADTTLLQGILNDASERLRHGEINDELVEAELHEVIGEVYQLLSLYPQAENHLPLALEINKRLLGENHPSTLAAMNNLATLYHIQGRYAETEPLYLDSLRVQKRVLGEDDPGTLMTMSNLAVLYSDQGRHAEAESLGLQVLEKRRRVLGEEHPETLNSMNNLASIFDDQRRFVDAESLYLKTIEIQKRVRGEEHPETLSTMGNLAGTYQNEGRMVEAESMYLHTLEVRKRVLGEEHDETLRNMANLAGLYREQARYIEAESLYNEVLGTQSRVLGEEHPDTLGSMYGLAITYDYQGRSAEAEPLYRKCLDKREEVLGEEHPLTLDTMNQLALTYMSLDRNAEAELLLLKLIEVRNRIQGLEYDYTLGAITNLGGLYNNLGRHEDAVRQFETSLPIMRRVLGMQHPFTGVAMRGLVRAYMDLEWYDEAEPLLLETLEFRTHELGEEHPRTAAAHTDLGTLYNNMQRYEEAARQFEISLPVKRRVLSMQHPWTGYALNGLATAYMHLGRREEAVDLYRELVGVQSAAADKPDADANALDATASLLLSIEIEEVRDPDKALLYATRACELEESAGGSRLPDYLHTLAVAQHLTDDTAGAITTLRRAISLIPDGEKPGLANLLAEYESTLIED